MPSTWCCYSDMEVHSKPHLMLLSLKTNTVYVGYLLWKDGSWLHDARQHLPLRNYGDMINDLWALESVILGIGQIKPQPRACTHQRDHLVSITQYCSSGSIRWWAGMPWRAHCPVSLQGSQQPYTDHGLGQSCWRKVIWVQCHNTWWKSLPSISLKGD